MKAFTLVELLVSIAIFTTITTVAVVNNSQFNSSVLLTNLAYEIGLSIRQAQVYGITVKQSQSNTPNFDSGYGIHFDLANDTKSYKLFEDNNNPVGSLDHTYNNINDIDVENFRIQKGNYISGIYLDGVSKTNVDITFVRPNPEAYIKASGGVFSGKAQICVKSPQGTARMVVVENTGQISVTTEGTSVCNN